MNRDMRFKIDATWAQLPKPGKRDVAAISMTLGERVLTRLLEVGANQPRDFVRASAVSLALWLADNWWRLRWEPIPDYQAITADWRLRHELTSASGGTAWPPLMIYRVGARVVVAPISGLLETGEPMPVEYLPIPVSLMSGRIFEDGVDRFFSTVTEMCAHVQDGAALAALVRQIQDERQDPEVAAWRRLEAQLGYDPDAAPETVIESLSELEERVGPEAIEEAAIGSPGAQAPQVLEQAIEATRASDVKVNLEVAAAAAVPCEQVDLTRPIWMVAEDAAGRLRNAMGRSAGPFLNRALGDALQVSWDRVRHAPPTARNLPYGARLREERTAEHVALQTRTPHDRRFELARFWATLSGRLQRTLGSSAVERRTVRNSSVLLLRACFAPSKIFGIM